MNGGYIIVDVKWLDKIIEFVLSGKGSDTIPGIYDCFHNAYSTGKMIVFCGESDSLPSILGAAQPVSIYAVTDEGKTMYTLSLFILNSNVVLGIAEDDNVAIIGG